MKIENSSNSRLFLKVAQIEEVEEPDLSARERKEE